MPGTRHGPHLRMATPHWSFGEGAFLGVATTPMTPELRLHFGAPEDAGVMISKIVDDSAAFRSGLLVGDIITAIDGESIETSMDLLHAIRSHDEGDSVTVEIRRDGKAQQVSAVLDKSERSFPAIGRFPHAIKLDCDDDGGDCDIFLSGSPGICDGDTDCDINISCDDGDCTCSVNGEETDCEELQGVHVIPGD